TRSKRDWSSDVCSSDLYAGFFRWLNNFQTGIPHYIQVDNVTGEVQLQTPPEPIRYSHSEILNRDVMRKLRFSNPFALFEAPTFEIDRKSTRLNSSHVSISYAVFRLKKKRTI